MNPICEMCNSIADQTCSGCRINNYCSNKCFELDEHRMICGQMESIDISLPHPFKKRTEAKKKRAQALRDNEEMSARNAQMAIARG